MVSNITNYILPSGQESAYQDISKKLEANYNCILLGEVGFGKSVVSLHTAYRLGFKRVIYITQAGLVKDAPTHDKLDVKVISYSKFRCGSKSLSKKTKRLALEKAQELVGNNVNHPLDTIFIFDEADAIKGGLNSQQGIVYLAMRYIYSKYPFLLMSGTLITTSHTDSIPFLMTFEKVDTSKTTFEGFLEVYKQLRAKYVVDIPIPKISRFATIPQDINKEQLLLEWDRLSLRYNKVRDGGDIKLSFNYVECETNPNTLSYISRLKSGKILNTTHGKSTYTVNSNAYASDGVFITDKDVMFNFDNDKLHKMEKLVTGKTIVLTAFIESLNLIQEFLNKKHRQLKVFVFNGDTSVIEEFKQCKTRSILLSTLPALSTGYNIDEADTIIYYSVTYNTKDLIQSLGRIDRKTTTRDKTYHFLYNKLDKKRLFKVLQNVQSYHSEFGFKIDLPNIKEK